MKKIKISRKKSLIIALATVLVAGGAFATYKLIYSDDYQAPKGEDYVNYDPASKADQKRAEETKERIIERDDSINSQENQNQTGKKNVTPVITYADQYSGNVEVGAYVSSIFEDGGQCTATFIKNDSSLTKTVNAVKNANSVDCPTMSVTQAELKQTGKWQINISYSSNSATGKSETREIEVK